MTSLRDDPEAARRILTERRAEAARMLETVEAQAAGPETDGQGDGDSVRIDELQQRQLAGDAARRRRRDLLRIDAALERLELGEYGHCLVCDAEIGEGRLALDPAAVLCLACAERV